MFGGGQGLNPQRGKPIGFYGFQGLLPGHVAFQMGKFVKARQKPFRGTLAQQYPLGKVNHQHRFLFDASLLWFGSVGVGGGIPCFFSLAPLF